MSTIEIRPYQPSDYKAVCEIYDAGRRVELELAGIPEKFVPFFIAEKKWKFFEEYPRFNVAVVDGTVAGFCACGEDYVALLYVAPEKRRQGIGKALARRALETQSPILYFEVLEGNEPMFRLCESVGYADKVLWISLLEKRDGSPVRTYLMRKSWKKA